MDKKSKRPGEAVVITGASTGIGRECAARLSREGFQVLAGVRKSKDAEAWRSTGNVTPLILDVTDEKSVRAALEVGKPILESAPAVHLINNAGIAVAGPVEAVPLSRWKDQFEVNVFGLLRVTQVFLPFIRAGRGRIVNVSSVSGLAAAPYLGPYAASKFAVEAISDSLRRELRQFGVKVALLEPGPVATPIWEKNLSTKEEMFQGMGAELEELYKKEVGRFLRMVGSSARGAVPASEVADAALHALSSPRPKLRYLVGSRATRAQARISTWLPARWVDAIVERGFR